MIPTSRLQSRTLSAQTSRAGPSWAPKSSSMTGSKHLMPAYLKSLMTSRATSRKPRSPKLVELMNTFHRLANVSSKRMAPMSSARVTSFMSSLPYPRIDLPVYFETLCRHLDEPAPGLGGKQRADILSQPADVIDTRFVVELAHIPAQDGRHPRVAEGMTAELAEAAGVAQRAGGRGQADGAHHEGLGVTRVERPFPQAVQRRRDDRGAKDAVKKLPQRLMLTH